MPLKGDIASFSLPEIIQSLSLSQITGTLTVSDGEARSHLYFRNGNIIPLTDYPLETPGLDRALVRRKKVDPETLEDIAWDRDQGIVAALVRRGLAEEADLLPIARQVVEESVYDLFLWDKAYFEFRKEEVPDEFEGRLDAYGRITLVPNSILMEAVRRVDEWGRIKAGIPSLKYIFVPADESAKPPKKMKDVPLTPSDLWPHLDGASNVYAVQERTGASRIDVCQSLMAFLQAGFVKSLSPERMEREFGAALKEEKFPVCTTYLEFAQALGPDAAEARKRMETALLSDEAFRDSLEDHRLSGVVGQIDFPSFLLALIENRLTGTIRLRDPDSEKVLHVSPQEVALWSVGPRKEPDTGEILVREGKLTNRELDRACTLARKRGVLAEAVLLEEAMVGETDMALAACRRALDEIFDIFLWHKAHFEFTTDGYPEELEEDPHRPRLPLALAGDRQSALDAFARFRDMARDIS
ncbi:MAG: DUF4388 domain-containing protein, partial [Planctomycetota bacterium]